MITIISLVFVLFVLAGYLHNRFKAILRRTKAGYVTTPDLLGRLFKLTLIFIAMVIIIVLIAIEMKYV